MTRPSLALLLATACGVGYAPVASGTFGSAVGLAAWAALPSSVPAQAAIIVGLFAAGTWSSGIAERHFGRADPPAVVVDEVVGMLTTLFLNPVGWRGALAAFLLFRVADIIKPFPARRFERLPGGLGVMADDLMAAVYANLVLRAVMAVIE